MAAAACRVQRVSSTCESLDVDSESKCNQFVIKVLFINEFRIFISKISKLVDKMQRCLYELSQHLFAILASEALRPQSFSASHSSTGKTPEGAAAIGDWMGLDFVSWRQWGFLSLSPFLYVFLKLWGPRHKNNEKPTKNEAYNRTFSLTRTTELIRTELERTATSGRSLPSESHSNDAVVATYSWTIHVSSESPKEFPVTPSSCLASQSRCRLHRFLDMLPVAGSGQGLHQRQLWINANPINSQSNRQRLWMINLLIQQQ